MSAPIIDLKSGTFAIQLTGQSSLTTDRTITFPDASGVVQLSSSTGGATFTDVVSFIPQNNNQSEIRLYEAPNNGSQYVRIFCLSDIQPNNIGNVNLQLPTKQHGQFVVEGPVLGCMINYNLAVTGAAIDQDTHGEIRIHKAFNAGFSNHRIHANPALASNVNQMLSTVDGTFVMEGASDVTITQRLKVIPSGDIGRIDLFDTDSSHMVTLEAPAALTNNFNLALPEVNGVLVAQSITDVTISRPIKLSNVFDATTPGEIQFFEGSGGGTNKVTLKGPDSLSQDYVVTLPAGDGEIMLKGGSGSIDLTGALQLKNGTASAGYIEFYEDEDFGTNKTTLIGTSDMPSDFTIVLPAKSGTVLVDSNNSNITFPNHDGQVIVEGATETLFDKPIVLRDTVTTSAGASIILKEAGDNSYTHTTTLTCEASIASNTVATIPAVTGTFVIQTANGIIVDGTTTGGELKIQNGANAQFLTFVDGSSNTVKIRGPPSFNGADHVLTLPTLTGKFVIEESSQVAIGQQLVVSNLTNINQAGSVKFMEKNGGSGFIVLRPINALASQISILLPEVSGTVLVQPTANTANLVLPTTDGTLLHQTSTNVFIDGVPLAVRGTAGAKIELYENAANGNNHITLQGPAALGSDPTVTFPEKSGIPVIQEINRCQIDEVLFLTNNGTNPGEIRFKSSGFNVILKPDAGATVQSTITMPLDLDGKMVVEGTASTAIGTPIALKDSATTSAGASIQFFEAGDNSFTHKATLSGPASLAADIAIALPSVSGTLVVSGGSGIDFTDSPPELTNTNDVGHLLLFELPSNGTNKIRLEAAAALAQDRTVTLTDRAGEVIIKEATETVISGSLSLDNLDNSSGYIQFYETGSGGNRGTQYIQLQGQSVGSNKVLTLPAKDGSLVCETVTAVAITRPITARDQTSTSTPGSVKFYERSGAGTKNIAIKAPVDIVSDSNYVLTLPEINGTFLAQPNSNTATLALPTSSGTLAVETASGLSISSGRPLQLTGDGSSNSGKIEFYESDNNQKITLTGQATLASDHSIALPAQDGTLVVETATDVTVNQSLNVKRGEQPGEIVFFEASTNGTNTIKLVAPAAITSDVVIELGQLSGVMATSGDAVLKTGAQTMAGSLTISDTTAATDTNDTFAGMTGALKVAGGIASGEAIHALGSINGDAVNATSDRRMKKDIQDWKGDALDIVSAVPVRTFKMKHDETERVRMGFIAQEMQEVLPAAVDTSNPEKLAVRHNAILAVMWASIQELKAENALLRKELIKQ